MRKYLNKLGAAVAVAGLCVGSAMAEGEPGAATITAVQGALEGTIGLLVTAAGAIALVGLGIWAAPFVVRKVKRFVSASA